MDIDFQQVVAELVRALRGRRSQLALSRRLRFRTNVVYAWERRRRHPSITQLLTLAERVGVDLTAAFGSLYPSKPPAWLETAGSRTDLAAAGSLLDDARGATPIVHLAELTGFSRFALARWLGGQAEPRAWEFMAVLHHTTHRLTDFVGAFTQGRPLESLRSEYERVEAARRVAERFPLSQALLRCLELESYALGSGLTAHFAAALGISVEDEREMLQLLEATGQIRKADGRWEVLQLSPLNMRLHRETAHLQRAYWASVASARAPDVRDALCAYNVCGVSKRDYEVLRRLQREYLQKARAIIEKSQPVQRVALLQVNLLPLVDDGGA